jgi:hypothetical protein
MVERWVSWEGEGGEQGKYMQNVVAERFPCIIRCKNCILCNKKSLLFYTQEHNFYSQQEHDRIRTKDFRLKVSIQRMNAY